MSWRLSRVEPNDLNNMCKSVDKTMTITEIYLESKKGRKSGVYRRKESDQDSFKLCSDIAN